MRAKLKMSFIGYNIEYYHTIYLAMGLSNGSYIGKHFNPNELGRMFLHKLNMPEMSKMVEEECNQSASCPMSSSNALVQVKPTQCPYIALHASLAFLYRQAEFSSHPA